jgi:RNA polymerase sigma-70 factor (ECF subfamily)
LSGGDAELLRQSAGGDRAAFDRFVTRHQDAVYRYLTMVSANEADAEDVLQETFLSAWRSAGSFRGGDSARGWLLTIARHALGRLHRLRVDEPSDFLSLDALGCDAGWGEQASEPAVDERRATLEAALARLSCAERELIVLRDLEGFSGEEVAALTGQRLAGLKSRLHRARLRLAAELRRVHG